MPARGPITGEPAGICLRGDQSQSDIFSPAWSPPAAGTRAGAHWSGPPAALQVSRPLYGAPPAEWPTSPRWTAPQSPASRGRSVGVGRSG
eukprot:1195395-Prorocentrum_minimum.AAC.2